MAEVALLNPGEKDADAAREMLFAAKSRREKLQHELSLTVLDREQYLLKIGASKELQSLENEMQRAYDRRFKV